MVGLIATTRRILVAPAEVGKLAEAGGTVFLHAMRELGLFTMVLGLVVALVLLQKRSTLAAADRA